MLVTEEFAADFAHKWIAAWNARDIERLLSHYANETELTSPFVSKILHYEGNTLRGLVVLRVYFIRALNAYPDLKLVLQRAYPGCGSLTIQYQSIWGKLASETMEFNDKGLVTRSLVHYAARISG
jgi:hypothetical protein